jgi:hypothetical protein
MEVHSIVKSFRVNKKLALNTGKEKILLVSE